MGERYEPIRALDAYLSGGTEENLLASVPGEILIDIIREAIGTFEKILAMGPRSLEFAAPDERESMLQAIATIRERKTALEQMLERVLNMEEDTSCKMKGEENCPALV